MNILSLKTSLTLTQNMSVEANLVRACSVNKVSSIMAEFTTTKRVHAVWRIPVQRTRRSNVLEKWGYPESWQKTQLSVYDRKVRRIQKHLTENTAM